jgi:hypothetical protein
MKTKIYASGNENIKGDFNVSYYILEKDKDFLDWLEKLALSLGVKNTERIKFVVKHSNDGLNDELYAKEIYKMIDVHEHYENGKDRIDLFYGKERIYLTLRKTKDARKKVANLLLKTKDWIKVGESKGLPTYATKKVER